MGFEDVVDILDFDHDGQIGIDELLGAVELEVHPGFVRVSACPALTPADGTAAAELIVLTILRFFVSFVSFVFSQLLLLLLLLLFWFVW